LDQLASPAMLRSIQTLALTLLLLAETSELLLQRPPVQAE
jgi:hypothetical protein